MPEKAIIIVDHALADAWKQRVKAATKAEKLAKLAIKAAVDAAKTKKAGSNLSSLFVEKASKAREEAMQASAEADKVWADTAAALHEE
mgnify:CR=1 FL=1